MKPFAGFQPYHIFTGSRRMMAAAVVWWFFDFSGCNSIAFGRIAQLVVFIFFVLILRFSIIPTLES